MKEAKTQVNKVLNKLIPLYAHVPIGIKYVTPFQLVVGVILSAQCTDERVNQVTATFFDDFQTAQDFAQLSQAKLEKMIKPTGFFRNKAKNILGAANMILHDYQGVIPHSMKELIKIPGFGRKTANVILARLYEINEGVCVDTHVMRLSQRLRLTKHKDPIRIERDLMAITSQKHWETLSHCLIWHGRKVCKARKPNCTECVLNKICPFAPAPFAGSSV
ncbi:MAG: endonuclease III [bacterium]